MKKNQAAGVAAAADLRRRILRIMLHTMATRIINPTRAMYEAAGYHYVVQVPHEPTEEEVAEMQRQARIAELKQLLAESDYKAIKFAEGWLTADEYADTKAQRQAWRNEINELEGANEQ